MVSQRVQIGAMCGEEWAENLLYRRFHKTALSFARKLAECDEDAEEIASEAMCRAITKIHTFNADRGKFVTWLRTIVKNTAFNYKKARRNEYGR